MITAQQTTGMGNSGREPEPFTAQQDYVADAVTTDVENITKEEYEGLLGGLGPSLFIAGVMAVTAWSIYYSDTHQSPTPQELDFTTPPFVALGLMLLGSLIINVYNEWVMKGAIEQ